MLRRRIRSALYIDFENVPLPPEAIGSWLAWLEDGIFDPARKRRRFLQKRVYWNSHAERNRDLFQKHGFVPILIGKYSGLKNGADIRMAMDVVETTYTRAEIDEFILLTGDSDFVPVIERLKQKAKRSAIVATEHRPNIHTTYHRHADLLIPSRRLTEAAQYRRQPPGVVARLLDLIPGPEPKPQSLLTRGADAATTGRPADNRTAQAPTQDANPSDPPPVLETAARRIARLLTQQPRNYVSQKRVLAELGRVQSFKRQGPSAYFGTGSYKALMRELARLEPRITVVDQPGGGTGVVYIPQPSDGDPQKGSPKPGNGRLRPTPSDAPTSPPEDQVPDEAPAGTTETPATAEREHAPPAGEPPGPRTEPGSGDPPHMPGPPSSESGLSRSATSPATQDA